MAEGDDLLEEAFHYESEKKYPDEASATSRKKIIRNKVEKFVIVDRELYCKPGREKQANDKYL